MGDVWSRLIEFCEELSFYALSYQRALFPYFALHDHVHARNVVQYAREISEYVGAANPAQIALLESTAYLHDCGMALPPKLINKLELTEGEVEKYSPGTLGELKGVLGDAYRSYFRNGALELDAGRGAPLSALDAYVVRKLHPLIGARYVERYLKNLIGEAELHPLKLEEVLEAMAALIRCHDQRVEAGGSSKCFEQYAKPCRAGGYVLDLGRLARALRAADAMDLSRGRAEFAYEHLVEDIKEKAPSQLKHWIFKIAVRSVRVDHWRKALLIGVEAGGGEEERRTRLLGVLAFEIAEHLIPKWEVNLGVTTVLGETEKDLQRMRGDLEKANECLKGVKLKDLEAVSGPASSYASQLSDKLRLEMVNASSDPGSKGPWVDKLMKKFDLFDALAHALYEEESAVLRNLLEYAAKKCPRAKLLLKEFQP